VERPTPHEHPALHEFTTQTRDMYVASGDLGFWQGALRDPDDRLFKEVAAAIEAGETLSLDLLYGDFEGGQRVISRFSLQFYRVDAVPQPAASPQPVASPQPGPAQQGQVRQGQPSGSAAAQPSARWLASVVRHWNVDRPDPR
jgi:hypothetical protein